MGERVRKLIREIIKEELKTLKESKKRARMRLKNLGISQEEIDQFYKTLKNKNEKRKFAKKWYRKKAKTIPDLRRLNEDGFLNLLFK